jgi:hypothetical protein
MLAATLAICLGAQREPVGSVEFDQAYNPPLVIVSFEDLALFRKAMLMLSENESMPHRVEFRAKPRLVAYPRSDDATVTALRRFLSNMDLTYRIDGGKYTVLRRSVHPHTDEPTDALERVEEPGVKQDGARWDLELEDEPALTAMVAICVADRRDYEIEGGIKGRCTLAAKGLPRVQALRAIAATVGAEVVERETGIWIRRL